MKSFNVYEVNGQQFYVPDGDTDSLKYFQGTDEVNIGVILSHVPANRHSVCVQAGGNLGYWPNAFSDIFDEVHTFEPDPECFFCLDHNCSKPNIFKYNCGLSDRSHYIDIEKPSLKHVGLNRVKPNAEGSIPTRTIDSLELKACDLIQLDVEGFEYFALKGAEQTILKYKPILAIEIAQHGNDYGVDDSELYNLIHSWRYQMTDIIFNDRVFCPV